MGRSSDVGPATGLLTVSGVAPVVEAERLLRRLRTCRADVADLVANISVLVDSPGLDGEAGHHLKGAWADELRPALDQLSAALSAAHAELDARG